MLRTLMSGGIFVFLFLHPHFFLSAQLDSFIPDVLQRRLLEGKPLSVIHFDNSALDMMPRYAELAAVVKQCQDELKPSVTAESICLYKKNVLESEWSAQEKTELLNGITALSTLAGLKYYSNSRGRMRLLYESSSCIDSPENQKPESDPVFTVQTIPQMLTLYTKQKDITFGENIYRYDFTIRKEALLFCQTNRTSMRYGIIPVLGKNRLRTVIAVIDAKEYLLVYMVSLAGAVSFPGMKDRIGASFEARSVAILDWFSKKADIVYGKHQSIP